MQDYQKQLVLNLLAYAVQKNVSPEELCARSGLELDQLTRTESDSLHPEQVASLWRNATRLSNDALFGLHFGESLQIAALGVVGELIRHSQTVGEGLTYAIAFIHLITDVVDMAIIHTDRTFDIRLTPNATYLANMPDVIHQMMDFFMAFTLHEVDGLVLKKVQPVSVKSKFTETNQAEYERVFRCRHLVNSADYALSFERGYWDEPILTADYELQTVFLRKATTLNDAFQQARGLSERITNFLLANAYLGIPTLEAIAANLNVSSRSLQRRLQQEGVTYQQLTDSIRKSLAIHYLTSGQYPTKEISYILGYNELSAFNRAFRRWTGTTPVNYQKRSVNG
ncbi:AraC family transcriptional regulator [Spirosoma aerolatum]|uniref:AraC family transcriptional regulator n=1 Tax=Spirosoma aerolatum TaxID=1211326 RepID=UPI0009AEB7F0|nr:AraC family transcriptional regulator [Spirosoma aerolatum]